MIGDFDYDDYQERQQKYREEAERKLCVICTQSAQKKCEFCGKPLCLSRYCNAEHKEEHFQPLT